jgi:D-tyrosyl-tRNA(Tyr) deacylase|tara:strand:- start:286 stop:720 length:435 start_codon:yes stop_codon:yes gene_type:complete
VLGLIQRVSDASVVIDGQVHSKIGVGLLLLLGIQREDTLARGQKLLSKIVNYRVFNDEREYMNLSLLDVKGSLLIVSQFTLAADTHKGLRPSFSLAAPLKLAEGRYNDFVEAARQFVPVETGRFGADMKLSLTNDGPVTFLLNS